MQWYEVQQQHFNTIKWEYIYICVRSNKCIVYVNGYHFKIQSNLIFRIVRMVRDTFFGVNQPTSSYQSTIWSPNPAIPSDGGTLSFFIKITDPITTHRVPARPPTYEHFTESDSRWIILSLPSRSQFSNNSQSHTSPTTFWSFNMELTSNELFDNLYDPGVEAARLEFGKMA